MMETEPEAIIVARPSIDYEGLERYLESIGGANWLERLDRGELSDGQNLAEFAGRLCYRSWQPGLNPNVTRVRTDQDDHLQNLLAQAHGSVFEHLNYSFILRNVSRVLTHELVRHRVGVAISQESLRFVRLTGDLPFWFPEWARADAELMGRATAMLDSMAEFQTWMASHFGLDDADTRFQEKKHKTSFMRRFAPEGVATAVLWTANVRTLRHTIEARTAPGAEEEMRLLFGRIGQLMQREAPILFHDYVIEDGTWVPRWRKV